jgi:hypothetical protein
MFLRVEGNGETAVIRFEGSEEFLDRCLAAVEMLLNDIMETGIEREEDIKNHRKGTT